MTFLTANGRKTSVVFKFCRIPCTWDTKWCYMYLIVPNVSLKIFKRKMFRCSYHPVLETGCNQVGDILVWDTVFQRFYLDWINRFVNNSGHRQNKKVLLRERKRHTDRGASSTPSVVLYQGTPYRGDTPIQPWTSLAGVPPSGPGRATAPRCGQTEKITSRLLLRTRSVKNISFSKILEDKKHQWRMHLRSSHKKSSPVETFITKYLIYFARFRVLNSTITKI